MPAKRELDNSIVIVFQFVWMEDQAHYVPPCAVRDIKVRFDVFSYHDFHANEHLNLIK